VPHSFLLRSATALAALAVAARVGAQPAPREVGSSANAWLDVGADVWLTPAYDLQVGGKVQRAELGASPQQAELRVGVLRPVGRRFRVAIGGLLARSSPYGPFPAAAPFGERRLWQHLLQDQRVGGVALQHRYRIEERWIERPRSPVAATGDAASGDPDVAFALRARYQLRATTPLGRGTGAHVPYAALYEEVLKSVGPHASTNLIDQNRAYAGVGMRWSSAVRTEVGYLNQWILRANGRQLEHGHTVQLSLGLTRLAPRSAPRGR
jgi:hypothetical protein